MAAKKSDLLWARLLYLVVYASYGTTSVYRTLYFRRIGLSGAEIGLLIALEPLVMLVAGPLWSLIADRLGLRTRLLAIVTGLSMLPMLAMIWARHFALLAFLSGAVAFFTGPIQPLMDSMALAVLAGERHKYASLRALGSLGYAPVMWLTGLFIQRHDIRWIFVGYAALMGAGCLLSLRMRTERGILARNIGTGLGRLVRDAGWREFVIAVFVAMMAQTVAFAYVGLYLDTLGASEGTIGLSGAVGSIGQTLWMLSLIPWLMRHWGSRRLVVLSFSTYALRFAIWALVPVPAVVVASQVLMGMTFGAMVVASVDFADRYAPPGLAATSQALVTGLVSGLGRSLGGVIAGPLYDHIGPQSTFGAFGLLCALGAVACGTLWWRRPTVTAAPALANIENPASRST